MRRLWIHLAFAFSAVVLISAALFFLVAIVYAERQQQLLADEFRILLEDQFIHSENGVVRQLQMLRENGGTLEQVTALLADLERLQPSAPFRLSLQLLTDEGASLYGYIPPELPYEDVHFSGWILRYSVGFPLASGHVMSTPPGIPRPEDALLTLIGIGTLMGLGGGVVMSRRLAAPLSQLAQAARQVGARDFSIRIRPSGTEEIRDVAQALNEMVAMLQESEHLRSNLVADVAHELRTPLTVMESSLRAMIDDIYPLTKSEILTLYDQTRHLSRLVNDLHELSLVNARELKFEYEIVSINALLESIAEIFKPVAEAEMVDFTVTLPAEPLYIRGDHMRMTQVIQNLLVNALRHTPAGGEIDLLVTRQAEQVRILVADSGEGIPAEDLMHVFERFYRADRSRNRASGGAGLGLAIGKAIIETHGGTITVSSSTQAPTGTRFTICLPLVE